MNLLSSLGPGLKATISRFISNLLETQTCSLQLQLQCHPPPPPKNFPEWNKIKISMCLNSILLTSHLRPLGRRLEKFGGGVRERIQEELEGEVGRNQKKVGEVLRRCRDEFEGDIGKTKKGGNLEGPKVDRWLWLSQGRA